MIISVSRRTDIPAFYWNWFAERLREQFVLVRNPLNFHQVSRVALQPEVIDGMVFWTKNPAPMLGQLSVLAPYVYYFQFTLNAYGQEIESNLPTLRQRIKTFQRLSELVGPARVIWRYDPILLGSGYDLDYHSTAFTELAAQLSGSTRKCIISFLDYYPKINRRLQALQLTGLTAAEQRQLAHRLATIARRYDLALETCAEKLELADLGIGHTRCIDTELLGRLGGCRLTVVKDKNQRHECGCAFSIDIGAYNTCLRGCCYCYANHSQAQVQKQAVLWDSSAPLLCSTLRGDDKVTERKMQLLRQAQTELF